MSSLRLMIAALPLLGGATAAPAQSPDALARHGSAARAAHAVYEAALERAVADSIARAAMPIVRSTAGFAIRADTTLISPAFLDAIAFAADSAERAVRPMFGVATASLVSGHVLTISARWEPTTGFGADSSLVVDIRGGWPDYFVERHDDPDVDGITEALVALFERNARERLGETVQRWLGVRHLASRAWDDNARSGAYFVLATTPSPIGPACQRGSIAACRAALAFVPDGDTLGVWYDADTRRARVAGARIQARDSLILAACLNDNVDNACRALLQHYGYPSPTRRPSRNELLRLALSRGGDSALVRLFASRHLPLVEQLEIAARVPLDTLIAAWRADLMHGQPRSPAPTLTEVLLVALSGAVLLAIAAGQRP